MCNRLSKKARKSLQEREKLRVSTHSSYGIWRVFGISCQNVARQHFLSSDPWSASQNTRGSKTSRIGDWYFRMLPCKEKTNVFLIIIQSEFGESSRGRGSVRFCRRLDNLGCGVEEWFSGCLSFGAASRIALALTRLRRRVDLKFFSHFSPERKFVTPSQTIGARNFKSFSSKKPFV